MLNSSRDKDEGALLYPSGEGGGGSARVNARIIIGTGKEEEKTPLGGVCIFFRLARSKHALFTSYHARQ